MKNFYLFKISLHENTKMLLSDDLYINIMSKKEDTLNKIKLIDEILSDRIKAIQKNNDCIPLISNMKKENNHLINLVNVIPEENFEQNGTELIQTINSELSFFEQKIPEIPVIHTSIAITGTSILASGCAQAISIIIPHGNEAKSNSRIEWAAVVDNYINFQNEQKRIDEITKLLNKIKDNLGKLFTDINDLNLKYLHNIIDSATFANNLRNFIYKFQGELKWIINKKGSNYQKFKWQILCDNLAKNGKGGTEHKQLLNMKSLYDSIIDELSRIIKNRMQLSNEIEKKKIYVRFVTFIYSVLNLIHID